MTSAFGDDRARERTRAAQRRRLRTHALALTHDDARLCDAVELTKLRLADIDSGAHGATAIVAAFGALAIGEHDQARAAIAAMFADPWRPTDSGVDGADSNAGGADSNAASARELTRDTLLHACLAGRFHAWTGDAHAAASWLEPAVRAVERVESDVTPLVARDLLALAEALGDLAAATRLRPRMRGADPDRSADAALLRSAGSERADATRPAHAPGLLAPEMTTILAHLLAGRTDAGVAGWTALAADHGASAALATDPSPEAALWLPHLLAVGILGIDPDAARGRVRLRLHTPPAWMAWGATNIRIGDALLEVEVSRDADHVEICVEQTDGPLPLTLILEPTVHAPIAAARVDGTSADLAIRSRGDAIVAPVQLVLDGPRTLAIDLGPGQ